MIRKILLALFLTTLCLPLASFAEDRADSTRSTERMDSRDFANGSIAMIREEQIATPDT